MFLAVTKKRTYWGFEDIWLTYTDSKPREVMIEDLSADTREAVLRGLQSGDLIETDQDGKEIEVEEVTVGETMTPRKKTSLDVSPAVLSKAKDLLKEGVTSIKREIAFCKMPLLLSTSLRLEQGKKKPRKTVISFLEKRLLALSGGAERFDYTPDLEVEEGEKIVLKRNDMVLFEEAIETEE